MMTGWQSKHKSKHIQKTQNGWRCKAGAPPQTCRSLVTMMWPGSVSGLRTPGSGEEPVWTTNPSPIAVVAQWRKKSKHKLIWLFVIKSGRTLGKLNDHAQGTLVVLWSSVCWAGRKSLRPCAMTELLTAVNLKSRNPINRRQDYHVPEMCGRLKWLISLNNSVFIYSIKTEMLFPAKCRCQGLYPAAKRQAGIETRRNSCQPENITGNE